MKYNRFPLIAQIAVATIDEQYGITSATLDRTMLNHLNQFNEMKGIVTEVRTQLRKDNDAV